jgi:hypothetical protein
MAKLQTTKAVEVEDARRTLADVLGPQYRVTVSSSSTLKVGRTGVLPSKVTLSHSGGGTSFDVRTTGLIVSRLVQAASLNPRIKRALAEAYPAES